MEATYLSSAEADLFEAWQMCEEIAPGLGIRFDAAVSEAIDQLLIFPHSAPHFRGIYRRKILRGFNYGIFYQVVGNRLVIKAVLHLHQEPDAILKRLDLL